MRSSCRRGRHGRAGGVPLALLVVAIYQLATAPIANYISRRLEAEGADWKAPQVTEDPAALEGLMLGFSKTGLGDPDPPGGCSSWSGRTPRSPTASRWRARLRSDVRQRSGRWTMASARVAEYERHPAAADRE